MAVSLLLRPHPNLFTKRLQSATELIRTMTVIDKMVRRPAHSRGCTLVALSPIPSLSTLQKKKSVKKYYKLLKGFSSHILLFCQAME